MKNTVSLDEESFSKPNHSDFLIFEVPAKANNWLQLRMRDFDSSYNVEAKAKVRRRHFDITKLRQHTRSIKLIFVREQPTIGTKIQTTYSKFQTSHE